MPYKDKRKTAEAMRRYRQRKAEQQRQLFSNQDVQRIARLMGIKIPTNQPKRGRRKKK